MSRPAVARPGLEPCRHVFPRSVTSAAKCRQSNPQTIWVSIWYLASFGFWKRNDESRRVTGHSETIHKSVPRNAHILMERSLPRSRLHRTLEMILKSSGHRQKMLSLLIRWEHSGKEKTNEQECSLRVFLSISTTSR